MSDEIIQQWNTGDNGSSSTPPPVYFLSLTVENFRCFGPSQTLDLSDGNGRPAPWTVILGDNGVGKTTLLQCLAEFRPNIQIIINSSDEIYMPEFIYTPVGSIHNNKDAYTLHDGKIDRKITYRVNTVLFQGEVLLSSGLGQRIDEYGIYEISASIGRNSIYQDIRGLICYGYGANRRIGNSSLTEKLNDDTCESLFLDNVDLLNAEEWLLQADYAANKPSRIQEQAKGRLDQIKKVLIELLPDVTDIRITEPENVTKSPSVQFSTSYGWVGIRSLSLGYRAMIAWMVDFTRRLFDRYPDSPNPLAEPAIVLVDEIDLHLHPQWQRKLREFLTTTFPNTQFIVTAHSPLVVQAASDANIILLKQEGNYVIIDNDVKTIQGWRVDQVLTSDLFGLDSARPPQMDALLKERTEILSKPKLTKADEARLVVVEAQIGDLPTGETPEDIDAMDIIRRAAELLKTP